MVTTGADTITFLKQAGQVKLPAARSRSSAPAFSTTTRRWRSAPTWSASTPWPAITSASTRRPNKRFVEAYRKKYNEWPNAYAGHAYDGINWFLDVVEKTGSWNAEKWVTAFERSTYDESVFGPQQMRACDHQALGVGLWAEAVDGAGAAAAAAAEGHRHLPAATASSRPARSS